MHKRSLFRVVLIWAILIVATALLGRASIAADNAATADFLNIGVGARSAAMGGAYSSVTHGADAVYWNPSGLAGMQRAQIMFSHFSWYQDLNYEFLSVAYPVNEKATLAVSSSFLSYGSIEGYDSYDNPTGELDNTYDMAAGLSFGYMVNDRLSVGLTGKYIMLSLAGTTASAFAADIGARYDLGKVSFAVTAANIGSDVKFNSESEKLPMAFRGGLVVRPFGNSLMASLEVEKQVYGDMSIMNGYEFSYEGRYFLRAGYRITPAQDGRELGQSPSFGAGAIFGPALFDYTFSPEEKYSSESIHRFSISFNL